MKKGIIIFTAIIIVVISFFIGKSSHDKIKVSEVKLITVDKKEYTKENDVEQVNRIVTMYNEAKKYRNDVGTTPSHNISILLNNGQIIEVTGNTQSYQTVIKNGKQYNISGNKLWEYFKSLDSK